MAHCIDFYLNSFYDENAYIFQTAMVAFLTIATL